MTLIEVLIALAIFAISFLGLIDSQNMTLRSSSISKKKTIATMLAQERMAEMLIKYKNKSITEVPSKTEGKYEGAHELYRWEETSRDFEYDLSFLVDMASQNEEEAFGGEDKPQSPLLAYLPKITQFIQKSSKEITVTIFWRQRGYERKISISTHLFNFKTPLAL